MKTITLKIELLVVFLIVGISLMGQQTTASDKTKSDRRIQKELKKEQKLIQQNEEFKAIVQALSDSSFVFEAKTISSGRGRTNRLDGTTSFFAIFGNQATLRVSTDASRGFFGQSSAGYLINYSILHKKSKKPVMVKGRIEPFNHIGQVMFNLSVFRDGNAILEIIPVQGNAYSMQGVVVLPQNSITYRGIPVIRELKTPEK
jgi:hypothetical protein